MNIKKKIIFTGLSLLLSNTFNSAYSADGADGDETNQPKDPSHKRSFDTMTKSDGPGAAGGASSSASNVGKTAGDAHLVSSSAVIRDVHEELKHTLLLRAVDAGNVEEICLLLGTLCKISD